jgi:AsmA family
MSKSLKIVLIIIAGIIGIIILVAAGLLFFVDPNDYKPRLETAASEALGMDVRIGGRLGIAFFPGLRVTLEDVQIRNRKADLASAKEVGIGIDLFPLLLREVRIREIRLKNPAISIERSTDPDVTFDKFKESQEGFPVPEGIKVSFSGGTFRYANTQTGNKFEAVDCRLNLDGLRLAKGEGPDFLKRLSFAAEAACGEIGAKAFTVSDLKFSVAGKDGVFDINPVGFGLFGGLGSGNIHADLSGPVPRYHVLVSLPQFRIEDFLKTLSPDGIAEGPLDFSADLALQGKTAAELKESAGGTASLRGTNLMIKGHDLDAEFSRFESSQNFNLADVGAFLLAGPVGLAVTKGYSFTSIFIFKKTSGSSAIRTLVSDWTVEGGVARAKDAAMTTKKNRIALRGGLDFVNEKFDDLIVAQIDARGCAMVSQKIHGPFQKPVVEKPSILASLAGPAISLLKEGKGLLPGGECERFYSGSVAPP